MVDLDIQRLLLTQQHNTPFNNPPTESEEVEVTDPVHPLYGRRFSILSVSHPPQHAGHVVVAYRDFMRLRLPLLATSLAPSCALAVTHQTHQRRPCSICWPWCRSATPCPAPPIRLAPDSTRA